MSDLTKICKKCNTEKSIESFWKNARYKDAKDPECIECKKVSFSLKKDAIRAAQRKWRETNPDYQLRYSQTEQSKEYHRQYYREHAEEYKNRKRQFRTDNPERERISRRKYVERNREVLNEYHRKWKATKRRSDPLYSLKMNVSRRIRYELHTLGKGRKVSRTMDYIGCSIEELKAHLESNFTAEMNWDNYGDVWHIDHRIPCSAWNLTDDFESKCCWNYRNLQPMIARDNLRKRDKYDVDEKNIYIENMRSI